MKNSISKILCILGIIILLGIGGYATYLKLTFKDTNNNIDKNTNSNLPTDNNQNEEGNSGTNADGQTTSGEEPAEKTLQCYYVYYDSEDTNANIREDIIVRYDSNAKAISQEIKKDYSFENENDYLKLKERLSSETFTEENIVNYDDTLKNAQQVTISTYKEPKNPNDKFDFRDSSLEVAKQDLTSKQYTCN